MQLYVGVIEGTDASHTFAVIKSAWRRRDKTQVRLEVSAKGAAEFRVKHSSASPCSF